uniref:Uncharacterized protein n=1 Tax=Cuerna arida TaxID=1464854 RepID=A0A1B6GGH2_9HEMI
MNVCLCFFFAVVIEHFALACENSQCEGPKYLRSNCCDGYVCVSRSDTPMLVCVNQRERSRVLNFDEILKTANNHAEMVARKNRLNYERDTAANSRFQIQDTPREFQTPQIFGTNRFQNPNMIDSSRSQYNQPISYPNRFQNGFLMNEPHRIQAQPQHNGPDLFQYERQPQSTDDFLSFGSVRGLPEGQDFFAM